jgi:hypothetical protein
MTLSVTFFSLYGETSRNYKLIIIYVLFSLEQILMMISFPDITLKFHTIIMFVIFNVQKCFIPVSSGSLVITNKPNLSLQFYNRLNSKPSL